MVRFHQPVVRRFGRIIFFIIVSLLCIGAVHAFIVELFSIRTIIVIGQHIELTFDADALPNNLLFFPSDKLRLKLLANYPLLKGVSIQKKFPSTLVIDITKRVAVAELVTLGRTVLLDEKGIVLGDRQDALAMPKIVIDEDVLRIGSQVSDRRVQVALTFIIAMKPDSSVREVTTLDSLSLRAKLDKTDIYIPQDGDIESRVATLQTLLSGFRIKGVMPAIIDLRFDKPVITW